MTHVESMDPHEAFAELGRIRLADIDTLLGKIAQLAKRTIPGAGEVSVILLQGDTPRTAAFTGAHSSLSVGLPVHELVTGGLNIYATAPRAFDDDAIITAQNLAGFAAVSLANAHPYETQATLAGHMQKAMDNRAVI